MKEKRKTNFLLYGQGSFLNKGCEAIVNTTIKKIKKSCEGNIVLSTNDMNDKNAYSDIITKYVKGYYKEGELSDEEREKIEYYKTISFDYTNFEKIYEKDCLKEIEDADICMSVGGDNYCYGEPNWIYTINKEIKAKNKKNVFWCTSLFENIESDEMIRDLKTYDLILARESLTYKALLKFMPEERLMLVPDTAFSLEKQEIELPKMFQKGKQVVGINISPLISDYTEKNNILDSIKTLINYILEKTDYHICLIPHVYITGNNDLETLEKIKEIYPNEERIEVLNERIYNCEELKYVISKCNYLIAARTHASIAGYSSIIPTLVIGYSLKSKGIALDLFDDFENYVIPVDKMTPDILVNKFNYLLENSEKIKSILKQKIPQYKEKADNLIEDVLDRLDNLEKKYITSTNKCTGCMACYNVCESNAIEMIENEEGFLYPVINKEKCTNCGKCKKVCPVNTVYEETFPKMKCYAAINQQEEDRMKSSSGGMISLFAKEILKHNGVVYGAELVHQEVKHVRIDKVEDLYKILGSKYVQSKIGDIYLKVQKDLKNNKEVLFTGTPCQIEGLKSFLKTEYENLTCISIICHGVPSPGVFKKYLTEIENVKDTHITNVNFRNKDQGWHEFSMQYSYANGEKKTIPFTKDKYMRGFLNNYYLRECCYNCEMRFGKKNRADVIVGDFWGIENVFPDMDDNKGISAVIINSEKGIKIFEKLKSSIKYKETTFADILKANPVLISSVKYTQKRNAFFEMIKNEQVQTTLDILNLENLYKEIEEKNKEITYLKGQVNLRDIQIEEKNTEIENTKREGKNYYDELQIVYNSKRWKYTNQIAKLVNKIKGIKG